MKYVSYSEALGIYEKQGVDLYKSRLRPDESWILEFCPSPEEKFCPSSSFGARFASTCWGPGSLVWTKLNYTCSSTFDFTAAAYMRAQHRSSVIYAFHSI